MKSLIIILSAAVMTLTAQAAGKKTLLCTDALQSKWRLGYNLSTGRASIESVDANSSSWKVQYKNAKVVKAADGGPMTIDGRDESEVDWSKTDRCYVFGKARINITIGRGGMGTLRILPNIKTKPNTPNCSMPRLMVPAPRDIRCTAAPTR